VVRSLAQLVGHKLVEFPMNSDTDSTELLGGFQQVNLGRHLSNISVIVDDVFGRLLADLSQHQDGTEYKTKLLDMRSTRLTFSSCILQECSKEELLAHCTQLKECLLMMEDVSTTLSMPLSCDVGEVLTDVDSLIERAQQAETGGKFEWVDSVLVAAVRHGHWVCITNCNVCNASVLDRLNPLVEPGGILFIDERGVVGDEGVTAITPHHDFRLFLLMDPVHGEMSRAMRNRGIEIYILPEETLGSVNLHSEDWRCLLLSSGLDAHQTAQVFEAFGDGYEHPVKLLQGAHCNKMMRQCSTSPLRTSKYLDFQVQPVTGGSLANGTVPPPLLSGFCEQPNLSMALRHFSVVLNAINHHISNFHDCNHISMVCVFVLCASCTS
jgi:midasin